MKKVLYVILLLIFLWPSAARAQKTFRIAMGSCSHQEKAQPLWSVIAQKNPDVWIWLGDNVYGDTEDMAVLRQKYEKQKSHPDYQALIQKTPVIGTWDDHDFGVNDGGKEYPKKKESQQLLLDFLGVAADSPLRQREGAYSSQVYGQGKQQIKVILLDARYFRDPLVRENRVYLPNENGTVLGEAQWQWLEKELQNSTASLHIIGSGIQFIPEEHPYEKWANFPQERKRFFDLLAKTKVKNVLLISGDRHMSELSAYVPEGLSQKVYELTSSGLTNTWSERREEPNRHRLGEMVVKINFGLLDIRWKKKKPVVRASIRGEGDQVYLEQELRFK
ncbi:MAG: hypothetical protein OHK0053_01130 [Microscillaceae bacterium]